MFIVISDSDRGKIVVVFFILVSIIGLYLI